MYYWPRPKPLRVGIAKGSAGTCQNQNANLRIGRQSFQRGNHLLSQLDRKRVHGVRPVQGQDAVAFGILFDQNQGIGHDTLSWLKREDVVQQMREQARDHANYATSATAPLITTCEATDFGCDLAGC